MIQLVSLSFSLGVFRSNKGQLWNNVATFRGLCKTKAEGVVLQCLNEKLTPQLKEFEGHGYRQAELAAKAKEKIAANVKDLLSNSQFHKAGRDETVWF